MSDPITPETFRAAHPAGWCVVKATAGSWAPAGERMLLVADRAGYDAGRAAGHASLTTWFAQEIEEMRQSHEADPVGEEHARFARLALECKQTFGGWLLGEEFFQGGAWTHDVSR